MKTISNFSLFIFIIFISSCSQQSQKSEPTTNANPAFDELTELNAILAVIEKETKCFFDGNYDCWASTWSHKDYTSQAWNNSDGTCDVAIGWDKINEQGKSWIETYYQNGKVIIHPDVKKEKPVIQFFSPTTAYLFWKQYNADKNKEYYNISHETRIMQKEDNEWKIVSVAAFWNPLPKIQVDSLKM